jgi:hypothetical protein
VSRHLWRTNSYELLDSLFDREAASAKYKEGSRNQAYQADTSQSFHQVIHDRSVPRKNELIFSSFAGPVARIDCSAHHSFAVAVAAFSDVRAQ